MDFTITKYNELLKALKESGYSFQRFDDFLKSPKDKVVILRHDVDRLPMNSLLFAKLQKEQGIRGVYYFRAVAESWNEKIIKEISQLGHEIGYHYECLTTEKGDTEKGIVDFKKNLEALRKLAPVSTICMHGSPMSKFDSKELWKKYSYKESGIIGEPYFDLDFTKLFYLTDTGRRWDGNRVSVRDKVKSGFNENFHSTDEIIEAVRNDRMPLQVMFTFHPQRWTNNPLLWIKELIFQNAKNFIKRRMFVKEPD